jgi:hypothetical protein
MSMPAPALQPITKPLMKPSPLARARSTALAPRLSLSLEAMMHSNFLLLGDGHIAYFPRALQIAGFLGWQYQTCEVPGATSAALRNPNSAVNAFSRYRDFLRDKSRQATVILQLGETDCGFVMWYRAQRHNETIADQLRVSMAAYLGFLHEIRYMGFIDIVITGATLPAIQDGHDWGESNDKRREVIATLAERTKLTLDYNKALQGHARELGLRYLDITGDLIDPATKTVQTRYINADSNDPQLDYQSLGMLWAEKMRALAASNASRRRLPVA